MCSCYVPTRNEEDNNRKKKLVAAEKRFKLPAQEHIGGATSDLSLKSNLKKAEDNTDQRLNNTEKRKVTWSDAHGIDIAHVKEFEPR